MLKAENIAISYGAKTILDGLSLTFDDGTLTSIIGPNGAGKSTLLKALSRSIIPYSGDVLLDGESIYRQNTKRLARRLAVLSQGVRAPDDYTVRRLVCCGRYPHAGFGGRLSAADFDTVDRAMKDAGIFHLHDRMVTTLSGGERQRAFIALLLAQEPSVMLLDEPTTFLDIGYQLELLELIRTLNREKRITVIMVLHDLNHAARYSDRMIALKAGKIAADGTPEQVMTTELLHRIFGVDARILWDEMAQVPYYIPIQKASCGDTESVV